jgi:hypothetical protein
MARNSWYIRRPATIELLNDSRKTAVTIIPVGEKLVMRIRLKGTSFDGRQDTVRMVMNDQLIMQNSFHYMTKTHSKSMEVMAIKDNLTKSIGFIPEEITRVLWKHQIYKPEILNVEVRKHIGEKPFFGITARIRTGLNTEDLGTVTKELEDSLREEKSNDEGTGTEA